MYEDEKKLAKNEEKLALEPSQKQEDTCTRRKQSRRPKFFYRRNWLEDKEKPAH